MTRGAKINGAMKGYGLGVSVGASSYRHCWGLRLRTSGPVFYLPPSARTGPVRPIYTPQFLGVFGVLPLIK